MSGTQPDPHETHGRDAAPAALPPPPPSTAAGRTEILRAVSTDAARSLARAAVHGRHRDRAAVEAEYDGGYWRDIRDGRAWERHADLEEFLSGFSDAISLRMIDGRLRRVADQDYHRWRARMLRQLVASAAASSTTLVELGCGWGVNLFSLSVDPRWHQLCGLDISDNGLSAGRSVAAHFGIDNVDFGPIDLTDPNHAGFGRIAGATVLTYYCLEQLPGLVAGVLDAIRAAQPARVIHIESAVGMLGRRRPLDLLNELYVRSRDYQHELVGELDRRDADGSIRLLTRSRLHFGASIHNEPCLLVWEPA